MREVLPGHHVACHLRDVQPAAFSATAAVSTRNSGRQSANEGVTSDGPTVVVDPAKLRDYWSSASIPAAIPQRHS
jgi:hypothetical protein